MNSFGKIFLVITQVNSGVIQQMQELQQHFLMEKERKQKHSIETSVPVENQPNIKNSSVHMGKRWQVATGIFLESMLHILFQSARTNGASEKKCTWFTL